MPKDKKKYSQKYTKIWETDPDLKESPVPSNYNNIRSSIKFKRDWLARLKFENMIGVGVDGANVMAGRHIKFENMIGVGVDGANVMAGRHNSVTAILKRELPNDRSRR
ncbi:hypothetical protein QE152_g32485 [Popillia japonica]|uniref:Uncharacterized protein n=1 Tax=Popillia japonica TaxID=7064 RepID=A0AAW1IZL3_POPJA